MAETFLDLPLADRREALEIAASASGRPAHLLDKDVWVVLALGCLFTSELASSLVFKGGTSLSKAHGAIRRFSEDVDLTCDIRTLIPDLVGEAEDPIPATRSQEKRWTGEVRRRLPAWIEGSVLPVIQAAIQPINAAVTARIEGDKLFICYEPIAEGSGYVRPEVMLEFGARSTGEPAAVKEITCDAAPWVEAVAFPAAQPRVMAAERTFWEKATAIHVFCHQGHMRADRFSRHWHDIVRLEEAGFADAAIADRTLADAVARHKAMFFREKATTGDWVDYEAAVNGKLRLVPDDAARGTLAADYAHMIEDRLFHDEVEGFDTLMDRCSALQERANRRS